MTEISAHRGEILHFIQENEAEHFADGLLIIEDGMIKEVGDAQRLLQSLPRHIQITEHPNCLITPGFVDTHVHYPQSEIIASYGEQLLEWLETYTFPAEQKFSDPLYASKIASFFLDQLLTNGTTTALVFATVHPESVDAFFSEAQKRRLRMICGKVMMDRNAPDALLDTPETSYQESRELIKKWHNKDRLHYAVTPRFAPTSSPEQLAKAGQLLSEFPDVYFQTHLSENQKECKWVAELFPQSKNYLDVYDQHQLLGKRSVFAHGIYLDENEWQRLAETDSALSYCPSSNLFIGSGLFKYHKAKHFGVKTGFGTDVGGGDSFSILRTINQAYKIQQLQGEKLSALESLYLATLGGAKALDLDDKIGNFEVGKEADFVILDYHATSLLKFKINYCKTFDERLFSLFMLADDRAVKQTYILGNLMTSLKPSQQTA
jgi:guanine deaminase